MEKRKIENKEEVKKGKIERKEEEGSQGSRIRRGKEREKEEEEDKTGGRWLSEK